MHDRTADKIAEVVSQVPNAAATIIPFDVESRVHLLHATQAARLAAAAMARRAVMAQAGDGTQAVRGVETVTGTPGGNGVQGGEGEKAEPVPKGRA